MAGELFIPLMTRYFRGFKEGDKKHELRMYGKRWNEKTCRVGRRVILSKGYGKAERLYGTITGFQVVDGIRLDPERQEAAIRLFGHINRLFIIIYIEVDHEKLIA